MNRIDATFATLRRNRRKGLVGFLTAGDPDPARSLRDLQKAVTGGLDILELGIPFSDPTADGPTIQAASARALAAGMTVAGALDMVRTLRQASPIPIVLFGYANPFFVYGYDRFCRDAAAAGADGLLVVDIPAEERGEIACPAGENGLCLIPLVAPTTPDERIPLALRGASGFVYYVMVKGVTGARTGTAEHVTERVTHLREFTDLPIAVGFGLSDGRQARAAGAAADAVVVGSALVKAAREERLGGLLRDLREGLDSAHGGEAAHA